MKRTLHQLAASFCGFLLLLTGAATKAIAAPKPNIVLIFVDDLGWRDVGFAGQDKFVETPHLDALRKEGMMFTHAYAAAGNCAPSRACLLSGMYGPRHGVYAVGTTDRGPKDKFRLTPVPNVQQLRPDIVTMAEALKAQGYATGHFGKWHLGSDKEGTGPLKQGFDLSAAELIPAGGGEDGGGQKKKKKGNQENDPKKVNSITDAACAFITAQKDKPFFAYVAHHAVHTPIQSTPETLKKFQAKAAKSKTTSSVGAKLAASIYDLDASIGKLLAHLATEKLDQNTIVIFTSDNGGPHGQTSNEPLRGAKGGYYEGGIREPFLVRWPGKVKPGSTCAEPIINVDLYPTFIAAAEGKPTKNLDGGNLLPLFTGSAEKPSRSAIFWHFPGYLDSAVPRGRDPVFRTRPVSVIRKGDWKLHLYHEEWLLDGGKDALATNKAVELYNIVTDPGERQDAALENSAKRDELLADLLAWMETTRAPLPSRRNTP